MYEEPVEPEVRNYYADLGVSDEAEEDDIKAAYRRLVLRHHPDKKALSQAIDAAEFRKVWLIDALINPSCSLTE
jgi:curved DNA-binding protein CbpA